jgi:cytochrome b6-f complex iron-sulfur subunit
MNEKTATSAAPKVGETMQPFQGTRRGILKGILGFLGALGIGSLFYGASRYLAPGAGGRTSLDVPLKKISAGGTYPFQMGGTPGLLFRYEDGTFKAFSLVCTHLACTVVWNPQKQEFYCPCHDGFFDADGNVISGPPPAPLERWKTEVRGDKVVIGVA